MSAESPVVQDGLEVVDEREYAVTVRADRGLEVRLTHCPACGRELPRTSESKVLHLATHDPEDFGLSPIGEVPRCP